MLEALSKEKPLAIIGDEDAVLGFQSLGFSVYAVGDQRQIESIIEEVIRQKNAVCLMQDNIYRAAQDLINNYKNLPLPIFIPFSKDARTDLLDNILRDIRIRAIGVL